MAREIACPQCGAPHSLVNPGIRMLVCSHCNAVAYWGDDDAVHLGEKSILPEDDTRLFLNAHGRVNGESFVVVGHLKYDYGRGGWDEWYLQLDDGSAAWLSEDQRQLRYQRIAEPTGALPHASQLQTQQPVEIEGTTYTVREIGQARCVGGEGQLPFAVMPGETYPYADIATLDGTGYGTLEYDRDGGIPTVFVGTVVGHDEIHIDDERPPASTIHQAESITCTECGGAFDIPGGREIQCATCTYCGTQLDLTTAERAILGQNPPDLDAEFHFEIGDAASFPDGRYEVCGRMLYVEERTYFTREYLLYNPDKGYKWLEEYRGHFVLNRPTSRAPEVDPRYLGPKTEVRVGDQTYRKYEHGVVEQLYVDGALPWIARAGDVFGYVELTAPPKIFGADYDGDEVEYFEGEYIHQNDVWAAFGRDDSPPRGRGVHAAQPFRKSFVLSALAIVGLVCALGNGGLLLWSLDNNGERVFERHLTAGQYTQETLSEPFELASDSVIGLELESNRIDDSWIALDVALVDESDRVVAEMDGEVSYYSGYEDGEHWTEGDRRKTTYFRSPGAGTYRLLMLGGGGSGISGPGRNEPLTVRVYSGGVLTRYFIASAVFAFLFPLWWALRRGTFEHSRWGPVTGDDDD